MAAGAVAVHNLQSTACHDDSATSIVTSTVESSPPLPWPHSSCRACCAIISSLERVSRRVMLFSFPMTICSAQRARVRRRGGGERAQHASRTHHCSLQVSHKLVVLPQALLSHRLRKLALVSCQIALEQVLVHDLTSEASKVAEKVGAGSGGNRVAAGAGRKACACVRVKAPESERL